MQQEPTCEVHGVVDLSDPEPLGEDVCPICGAAHLVWDLVKGSFQAVCPACGPVQVRVLDRKLVVQPFVNQRHFAAMQDADQGPRGPRGRAGRLVAIGAIRAPRAPRPKLLCMPPYEGGSRPS